MYTCPTDDIHSIYLDGELPDIYLKEYEVHVKNCSECAKKLQKLQKLRSLFKSDSEMLTLDKIAMDESFKRLNTKLHYSKNTTYVYKVSKNAVFGSIAAAAAAIFIIASPFRANVNRNSNVPVQEVAALAGPQVSIPEQNVVINGNIPQDFSQNVSTGRISNITQGDFFRPSFSDDKRLYIRISDPRIVFNAETPEIMEMKLPINNTNINEMPDSLK